MMLTVVNRLVELVDTMGTASDKLIDKKRTVGINSELFGFFISFQMCGVKHVFLSFLAGLNHDQPTINRLIQSNCTP